MKTFGKLLLLSLLFTWGLNGCQKSSSDTLRFKTITYADSLSIIKNHPEIQLEVAIKLTLPIDFGDKEVLENIQKTIIAKSFGEKYNSYPIDSIPFHYTEEQKRDYREVTTPIIEDGLDEEILFIFSNTTHIDGEVVYQDDKILTYSIEIYGYFGGAHGVSNRSFYNFDLATGYFIKEEDLFIPNYQKELTQLIKEQLVADNVEIGSVSDLAEYNFWEENIVPNNNFAITKNGLRYLYNEYEIAPYSMGQIEADLPYTLLKPLIKKGSPIDYLLQ